MRYLVTAQEMRKLDEYAISRIGIPGAVLMERAALAAFEAVRRYCAGRPDGGRTAFVMAGAGNNGGDGLALARLLSEAGFGVEIRVVGAEEKGSAL